MQLTNVRNSNDTNSPESAPDKHPQTINSTTSPSSSSMPSPVSSPRTDKHEETTLQHNIRYVDSDFTC